MPRAGCSWTEPDDTEVDDHLRPWVITCPEGFVLTNFPSAPSWGRPLNRHEIAARRRYNRQNCSLRDLQCFTIDATDSVPSHDISQRHEAAFDACLRFYESRGAPDIMTDPSVVVHLPMTLEAINSIREVNEKEPFALRPLGWEDPPSPTASTLSVVEPTDQPVQSPDFDQDISAALQLDEIQERSIQEILREWREHRLPSSHDEEFSEADDQPEPQNEEEHPYANTSLDSPPPTTEPSEEDSEPDDARPSWERGLEDFVRERTGRNVHIMLPHWAV